MEDNQVFDSISLVTGVKSKDNVIGITATQWTAGVAKYAASVENVSKNSEMKEVLQSGKKYERVFLGRETFNSRELVDNAIALKKKGGLLCFCSSNEGMREMFIEDIEGHYPEAQIWSFDSNSGKVIVTDAESK